MLHSIPIWLAVVAFAGAGLFNALGSTATQRSFVRWGYPAWWCRITGALELTVALLIAFPASRTMGLTLGAVVLIAAAATVFRHQDLSHVVPIGIFAGLLVLAGVSG